MGRKKIYHTEEERLEAQRKWQMDHYQRNKAKILKKAKERYRLKKIIKFIDHCDEMPVAYKIANLVCSCSTEPEAFGRISVEAQSMGIPIIASDIGGSTETIVKDKTGYLFTSGDSNALTNAIIMVMQKDYNSLKSIGFEGRKNILKKFDVDKMCHTTFTEYKKLIELS